MTATINGSSVSVTITTVHGLSIPVPLSPSGSANIADPNGNQISATYSSGTTTFEDTLGTTALTVSAPGGGSPATYTFPGPNGSYTYTVKYTQMTVATAFGCYGIIDFPSTQQYLVTEIDLPDQGSNSTDKYTFTYEPTVPHVSSVTGRLASVTLPTGGTITYSYSGGGGANGINCGDGSAAILSRYTPDTGSSNPWQYSHVLTGPGAASTTTVTDPEGNTIAYNFQGILETERQVKQGGSTLLEDVVTCYNGNSSCNTTPVSSPVGQITATTTLGTEVSKTNTSYGFDGLPWEVDEYDFGNGVAGGLLRKTVTTFGTWNNPSDVQVQDGGGAVKAHTSYALNSYGNVTGETDYTGSSPASINRTYTPNSYGVVTSSTDYNGDVTTYGSFECNNAFPGTITTGGLTTTLTWDCNGGVVTDVADANGKHTQIHHTDPNFWLVTEKDYPDNGQVQTIYGYGNPYTVTTKTLVSSSPNVYHQTEQTLDSLGRVHESQDISAGSSVIIDYDTIGHVYSLQNPAGGTTYYSYDALSRNADSGGNNAVKHPDGSYTSISYPPSQGNCATVVDPAGKGRTTCNDGLGRIHSVTEDPGGLGYQSSYTYDPLNDLTNVSQNSGAQTRTYSYDWLSRLTSATTPESGTTLYSYVNSSGAVCSGDPTEVCQRTDARGVTTAYTYDALHRLTSKGYNDGTTPNAFYSYDLTNLWGVNTTNALGRLVLASTWSGSNMLTANGFFSYDPMGRVQSYLQCNPDNCGVSGWGMSYNYDLAGDVQSWTHPAGFTITNSINAAQQITQVSSSLNDSVHPPVLAQNISYTPWGAISSLTNGCVPSGSCTNTVETYTYNNRMQPTGVQLGTSTNPSQYYSLAYNYSWPGGQMPPGCSAPSQSTGNNGNVMGYTYTDSVNSSLSHTALYAYDGVNRLACAQATGNSTYNLDFSYDPYGNMTCVQNGSTNGYCPQNSFNASNQISGYPYDAAGDLTNDPTHNFQYDAEQRVKSVGNGAVATLTYNALGQRVEGVWWGGNPLDFVFDPYGTWQGTGGMGAVYLGSRPLAFEYLGSGADFMHVNPLNSTTMETSYNGGVASDVLFYPFGDLWTNAEIQDYQFAGTIWMDSGSTADLASYRLYRYDLGRWLTPDPAGLGAADLTNPQSLNLYSYALNNPTTLTDPLGLFEHIPVDCSACPSEQQVLATIELGACGLDFIAGECLANWAVAMGPGGPGEAPNKSQAAKNDPQTGVPANPCASAGGAPDPSSYVAQVQQAGNQLPGSPFNSANSLMNQLNQFTTLLNFHRGGSFDAQPLGGPRAYGNYVFGAALSAAGYSLTFTLSAANTYAFISRAKYPGQVMDSQYGSIPAANVANITNGYNAQQNGTVCHN